MTLSTGDEPEAFRRLGYRRSDIQGLRAVAVLAVVVFHAGLPLPGGFAGVDVFFVISGFVITQMLMREISVNDQIRLRHFYWRRFIRLAPALGVMLTVTALVSVFVLSPFGQQQNTALVGLSNLVLAANVGIARTTGGYFDLEAISNPLLNTWSLSVEEQVYLVYPIVFLVILSFAYARMRMHTVLGLVLVTAGILSFCLAVIGSTNILFQGSQYLLGFYSPVTRFWEFIFGAAAFLVVDRFPPKNVEASRFLSWAGAAGVFISFFALHEGLPYPGPATVLPVASTALLLIGGTARRGLWFQTLSHSGLTWVGDRSYSIYLWHWPVIVLCATVWPKSGFVLLLAAIGSFVPSILAYRFIENPIRQRKSWLPSQKARLAAGVIGIPLSALILLFLGANAGWGSPGLRSLHEQTAALHSGLASGCAPISDFQGLEIEGCQWNVGGTGTPVYLVGDSNADMFSEGIVQAALSMDNPVFQFAKPGCFYGPTLDGQQLNQQARLLENDCQEYVASATRLLTETDPGIVIISNTDTPFRTSAANEAYASGNLDKYESWLSGVITQMQSQGHFTAFLSPIPKLAQDGKSLWEPGDCSLVKFFEDECSPEFQRTQLQEEQVEYRDLLKKLAPQHGVFLVDLDREICPDNACTPWRGEHVVFKDSGHISVSESFRLSGEFQELLSSVTRDTTTG